MTCLKKEIEVTVLSLEELSGFLEIINNTDLSVKNFVYKSEEGFDKELLLNDIPRKNPKLKLSL